MQKRYLDEHGNWTNVPREVDVNPFERENKILLEKVNGYKLSMEQKSSEIRSLKSLLNERDPKKAQEYVDLEKKHAQMNDQFHVLLEVERRYNELQVEFKQLQKDNKELLSIVNELQKVEESEKKSTKAKDVSKAKGK